MRSDTDRVNHNELRELVIALASRDIGLSSYEPLCRKLWDSPYHRTWLSAALISRVLTTQAADAKEAIHILAGRAREDLSRMLKVSAPSEEDIRQCLEGVVCLLPGSVWDEPWRCWPILLVYLCQEFDLSAAGIDEKAFVSSDPEARELAVLFARGIGGEWTSELDTRLESWRGRPEHEWLVLLRRTQTLDQLLEVAREHPRDLGILETRDLAERLQQMAPFERRRIIVLHDKGSGRDFWPSTKINEAAKEVEWTFTIQMIKEVHVEVHVKGKPVGQIQLTRSPDGSVEVHGAEGIMRPLKGFFPEGVAPVRAAASGTEPVVRLTNTVKGQLSATRDKLILRLRWEGEKTE